MAVGKAATAVGLQWMLISHYYIVAASRTPCGLPT